MNLKYLFFSLLSTCLIIYVSYIPGQSLWGIGSLNEQIIFNLTHIPAYGFLTFLWLKALDRKNKSRFLMVNALFVLMGLILFAISEEIHQAFVPGRVASCMDVGLDTVGILFGLSVFKIFRAYNIV